MTTQDRESIQNSSTSEESEVMDLKNLFKQAKNDIDANLEKFVDWKFEEWVKDFERVGSSIPAKFKDEHGYAWLRAAFRAGAKR